MTSTPTTSNSESSRRGFYLHTSWEFEYPFAVRSWTREDLQNFFALLSQLDFNLVMYWPFMEAMPAPLSDDDRQELGAMRALVDDAHDRGLEFWITSCANATSRPEIAEKPLKHRHLYPFRIDVRLDDDLAKQQYLQHRAQLFQVLNNADGYVTIDGDPGGYPGAEPRHFVEVLQADRAILDAHGTHPQQQKVIPWIWSGWGADWEKNGTWQEPLEPLTMPLLEALKNGLSEPWELLPGRSIREGWANGRTNFELAERAELIEKSTMLCYEIIEYEPTPPAVVIQFDDIRRVLKEEKPLIEKARGVMGNAQQPIMAIPNLFFFARAAQDTEFCERSDHEVLSELAAFLGGDAALLVPAWDCLRLNLESIPAGLPQLLRATQLKSEAAQNLPGGSVRYLEILAAFVEARLEVLRASELEDDEVARREGVRALENWWNVHRYVYTGEQSLEFSLEWTHPLLRAPLEARGLV